MRKSACVFGCLMAVCMSRVALAQDVAAACASALKPDTYSMHQDYMASYQYLNLINSSNYEQEKQGGGITAIIEDLPVGANYQQFSEKREEYQSKFQLSADIRNKTDLLFSSVSNAGYQAYAECLRTQSNAPVAAWVSFKTANQIYIHVKSYLPEGTSGTLQVDGDAPLHPPHPLSGATDQTLVFKRDPTQDFGNAFDVLNAQGNAI